MTDFRLVWVPPRIQWRYRPGFSPGSLFSCGAVTASAGTQTEYLLARTVYTIAEQKSIEKEETLIFEINRNRNQENHKIIDNILFLDNVSTEQYSLCEVTNY